MRHPEPDEILAVQAHRPWPVPGTPWIMRQSWVDLLFAHRPVDPQALAVVVPRPLPPAGMGGDCPLPGDGCDVFTSGSPSPDHFLTECYCL